MSKIIPPFTLSLFLAATMDYTPYWGVHVMLTLLAVGWLWIEINQAD